jgi:hypothetical protein
MEATRGCGRMPHVLKGLISTFFFDILHIPSGYKWLLATGLIIATYAVICCSDLWTF